MKKKVCFYISSHGFGHFARDIIIINSLLENGFSVTAKSLIDFKYFKQRIPKTTRKFEYLKAGYDAGCIQKNFIDLDIPQTIKEIKKIIRSNYLNFESEKKYLENSKTDLVISDAASFPLFCAKAMNIPSILLTNFTWYDIYSRFPDISCISEELKIIKDEYRCADIQYFPGVATPNNYVTNQENIGFISASGKSMKNKLKKKYGLGNKKICFIYFGSASNDSIQWRNLNKIEDYYFITHDRIKTKFCDNIIKADDDLLYADLIASSDVVATKVGYSTLALCLRMRKPFIFCGRKYFYEYKFLKKKAESCGIGLKVSDASFYACRWKKYLDRQLISKIDLSGIEFNGERTLLKKCLIPE